LAGAVLFFNPNPKKESDMKNNQNGFANERATTTKSADYWKRKTAMAIGKPELADGDDDELEKAHDAHIVAMQESSDPDFPQVNGSMVRKGMPPGAAAVSPASVSNESSRRSAVQLLVNDAMSKGMSYDNAFRAVAESRPDLIPPA
jgi:hypothetical protein